MSAKNWEGQEGLSEDCTLPPELSFVLLLSPNEHPCDRCNMDRAECHGFPQTPEHAARLHSAEPQP